MDRIGPFINLVQIGENGFGTIYKGRDPSLERFATVTLLNGPLAATAEFAKRFISEAQAVSGLCHPGIAAFYSHGFWNGSPYMATETSDAEQLSTVVARRRPSPAVAAEIATRLAEALEYAHAEGVVHLHLNPTSVRVGPGRRIKITDFGLAGRPTVALAGQPTDMVGYAAPEQLRVGDAVDRRADIFSLGAILHEMLVGAKPPASGAEEVHPARPGDPLLQSLAAIAMRCLADQPDERYQSAGEVAELLRRSAPDATSDPWPGTIPPPAAAADPGPSVMEPEPIRHSAPHVVPREVEALFQAFESPSESGPYQSPLETPDSIRPAAPVPSPPDPPPTALVEAGSASDEDSTLLLPPLVEKALIPDLPADDSMELPADDPGAATLIIPAFSAPERPIPEATERFPVAESFPDSTRTIPAHVEPEDTYPATGASDDPLPIPDLLDLTATVTDSTPLDLKSASVAPQPSGKEVSRDAAARDVAPDRKRSIPYLWLLLVLVAVVAAAALLTFRGRQEAPADRAAASGTGQPTDAPTGSPAEPANQPVAEASQPVPEASQPVAAMSTPFPEASTPPVPEASTPTPEASTPTPEASTPTPEVRTRAVNEKIARRVAHLLGEGHRHAAANDWTQPGGRCALDSYVAAARLDPSSQEAKGAVGSVFDFFLRRTGELIREGDASGALVRWKTAERLLENECAEVGLSDLEPRRAALAATRQEIDRLRR